MTDLVAQIGCRTADTALSFAVPAESEERVHVLLADADIDPASPVIRLRESRAPTTKVTPAPKLMRTSPAPRAI